MAHQILVSSYTNDIVTLAFDPATPSVSITSSTTVGHHPSWITAYPDDRSLIFTGLEQTEGKVIALKYGKDGQGRIAAELSSGGADPCTLLATKGELLVGNVRRGSRADSAPLFIIISIRQVPSRPSHYLRKLRTCRPGPIPPH